MIAFLAASIISPLFFEATPEVRSTYVSLGKLMEDRPMQITYARFGCDTGAFGRFGVRNWDVSSLTDRRAAAHRQAFYHTEVGPTWQYDLDIADDWRLKSDFTRSWTFYRRFYKSSSNRTYHWYQIEQSLENPYLVPFYRLRKCFRGNDYVYFKVGVRRRFAVWESLSLTPSAYVEGGSSRNYRRTFGDRPGEDRWHSGVSSASFRMEASWSFCENVSAFVFAEQYEVVGQAARHANEKSTYRCAHNDWTLGGVGLRLKF